MIPLNKRYLVPTLAHQSTTRQLPGWLLHSLSHDICLCRHLSCQHVCCRHKCCDRHNDRHRSQRRSLMPGMTFTSVHLMLCKLLSTRVWLLQTSPCLSEGPQLVAVEPTTRRPLTLKPPTSWYLSTAKLPVSDKRFPSGDRDRDRYSSRDRDRDSHRRSSHRSRSRSRDHYRSGSRSRRDSPVYR